MIPWKKLESEEALQALIEKSNEVPSAIFKHSNRCGVSHIVMKRLEREWDIAGEDLDIYFLDLVNYRDLSDEIETVFGVRHESPQLLVIKDGKSVYDASHGEISLNDIKKTLNGSRKASQ